MSSFCTLDTSSTSRGQGCRHARTCSSQRWVLAGAGGTPVVLRDMRGGYRAAGADGVETDTCGGTRIVLAEYGLQDKVREITATAARLARAACARFETADHPRFAAGSMGPGTKTISVTGG